MKRTLGILLIGICAAVLFGLCSGCSKSKGNLAFVGNPVASGSSFVFTLTNTGDSAIFCVACRPQTQTGGAWSDVLSIPQTNLTSTRLMAAGQSSQVTIAAPVGGAPWRLEVLWARVPVLTPWQRVELVAQMIFRRPNRGLPIDLCTNFSTVVSP